MLHEVRRRKILLQHSEVTLQPIEFAGGVVPKMVVRVDAWSSVDAHSQRSIAENAQGPIQTGKPNGRILGCEGIYTSASKNMRRFCLMLDLRPDPALIAEYIRLHRNVWPEIQASIRDSGVLDMQIFQAGNRLFMIMDTADGFSLERKAAMDAANPKVLEWETLMGRFQQVDTEADPTTRWVELSQVFQLSSD